MKNKIIGIILILACLAGLGYLMKVRAPKPPKPTTKQIWAENGIPVQVSVIGVGDMNRTVAITGNLTALDSVNLSAKTGGRIAEYRFREGDAVKAGQVVIVLDQEDQRANLSSARESLKSAEAALEQARTDAKVTKVTTSTSVTQAKEALRQAEENLKIAKQPVRTQELSVAENAVSSAKANLDNATANYNRYQRLMNEGAVSKSVFESYETQYKVAKATYDSALEQLSLAREGSRSEDLSKAESAVNVAKQTLRNAIAAQAENEVKAANIKSAKAAVSRAHSQIAIAKEALDSTYVRSSITGIVSSRVAEPGQVIGAGQTLGQVVNLNSVYFKGDVSEKDIAKVRKGRPVLVNVDALGDEMLQGYVDEIFPAGSEANRNFPVRIKIDNAKEYGIKPGMFARGKIITDVSPDAMLIPRDAIADLMGNKVVFTVERDPDAEGDGEFLIAKRHDVKIAHEDGNFVQLTEDFGLRIGDRVVTSGRQNLQNNTKIIISKHKDEEQTEE